MMLVAYPALFYYDASVQAKYFVTFPDFENSATRGKNIQDALEMASEYLEIVVADLIDTQNHVPSPSDINILDLKENDPFKNDDDFQLEYDPEKFFVTLIYVDINNYLGSQNPVKKL